MIPMPIKELIFRHLIMVLCTFVLDYLRSNHQAWFSNGGHNLTGNVNGISTFTAHVGGDGNGGSDGRECLHNEDLNNSCTDRLPEIAQHHCEIHVHVQ